MDVELWSGENISGVKRIIFKKNALGQPFAILCVSKDEKDDRRVMVSEIAEITP